MGAGASAGVSAAVAAASPDELQAVVAALPPEMKLKLKEVLAQGTCTSNPDGLKIVNSLTHFNPPTAFGAPRFDWMDAVDALAEQYGSGLTGHGIDGSGADDAIIALFAEGATWIDPVGGEQDPYVGVEGIKKLLGQIPKVVSSKYLRSSIRRAR